MAISWFSSRALFGGLAVFALLLAIISPACLEAKTPRLFLDADPAYCESLSEKWHGRCLHQDYCDQHCRFIEDKEYGECHGFWHRKCYCYVFGKC